MPPDNKYAHICFVSSSSSHPEKGATEHHLSYQYRFLKIHVGHGIGGLWRALLVQDKQELLRRRWSSFWRPVLHGILEEYLYAKDKERFVLLSHISESRQLSDCVFSYIEIQVLVDTFISIASVSSLHLPVISYRYVSLLRSPSRVRYNVYNLCYRD